MTPLTRGTVEKLIEMMQADFMLRADLGKFANIWQTRLSDAGLQDEDAHEFYQRFLNGWKRDRKPFLQDLAKAIRDNRYGKQDYWETTKREGVVSPERARWWINRMKAKLKGIEDKWSGREEPGKDTREPHPKDGLAHEPPSDEPQTTLPRTGEPQYSLRHERARMARQKKQWELDHADDLPPKEME